MDFSTEIENGKIHLYCCENERKVSDYVLDMKEAQHLVRALLQIIKPWKYAQGEDLPAQKTVNAEDVLEWLGNNPATFCARWCKTEIIIEQFKKDFGL